MSPVVAVLLLLAGLSEALGRLLPMVARRPGTSRSRTIALLLTGALIEGSVFALWPLTARTLAGLTLPSCCAQPPGDPSAPLTGADALTWTPGLAAPLLLAAVLAFPLLGPLLHLLLLVGVGASLAAPLATLTGLGWWTAAGCVALAGIGLGITVEAVRYVVIKINTPTPQELPT
ncbi:hypothetical protein [Sphaerisporangium dianthi]|uniref:Integral membrane protein n=1 Tax=Sphaerisporangium dianthi TaxID=1436120 RepID=A0ABV9CN02_9ACTN